jgi:tetratricopeptide (TPR) repeat protein
MKKLVIAGFMFLATGVFAQKSKVTSAGNYLKYENYAEAKEAIDAAMANPVSADWWKTHYYRGKVYAAIARSADPAVKGLDTDAVAKAAEGFEKALTYDDKKMDKDEIKKSYRSIVNLAFTDGVNAYNAKEFDRSIKSFKMAEKINLASGIVDTGLTYNIVLVALDGKKADVALEYLNKCIEGSIKGSSPYASKANLQGEAGDEEGALATLQAGREKYPNDQALLTQELNYYLKNGKMDEALTNLNIAIENEPTNYMFYFARGTIYDNKKELDSAVANYVKSGDLKPDHFDSFYNLGALYYNQGADLLTEANLTPPSESAKYEKLKSEAVMVLEKGLPYLEKAHGLNPTDGSTMNSLKTLYTLVGENEKAIEMNKKIEGSAIDVK